jgi:hypothetical protein
MHRFLKNWYYLPRIALLGFLVLLLFPACKTQVTGTEASSVVETADTRFAGGTKGVKIITANLAAASFDTPTATPAPTVIPSPYPGNDGTTTYRAGVSAARYFTLDGSNQITKPNWLLDFQLGITSTTYSSSCASFGGGGVLDPINQYRVNEYYCSPTSATPVAAGIGDLLNDPVFFRIILDRNQDRIGSAENLLIQVEYQASGLHFNADGSSTNPEENQDLLWKIYWHDSLASTSPKTFGLFIPPIYSACDPAGVGTTAAPGSCPGVGTNTYRGAPIKVRQFIIPLAAYPDMKVIQFSRVRSRINNVGGSVYVNAFCGTGEKPLCMGVVIRSVSIMRI